MEIFVPNVNKLAQHLLSALPGDKIDGMSAGRCHNKGSIGQYEGLREPTRKSQRDNNCDPSREEGCQHAEHMTNDEHNLC